jgi:hypothetical protein
MYFIEGRPRHRAIVEEYVSNLMVSLNIHRFTSRAVNIEFLKTLDGDAQGLCNGDKQVALISINKSIPFLRQMQALAHEMVHAKQFLRGELGHKGSDLRWQGKSAAKVAYIDQPWEVEAYRLERDLFLDCFPFDLYN